MLRRQVATSSNAILTKENSVGTSNEQKGWSAANRCVFQTIPGPTRRSTPSLSRVLVKVERCAGVWCRVRAETVSGYARQTRLWGVYPGEVFLRCAKIVRPIGAQLCTTVPFISCSPAAVTLTMGVSRKETS
ncbi:SH3 domain-containing protein [Bradyrhizobium sp. CCBAU 53415]|uniref:SH3 domain-containing protein n=1 Tax=Bradyrhizobium sp. CCBAU 53415 TaxID=1325119 RepID=UPI003FA4376F